MPQLLFLKIKWLHMFFKFLMGENLFAMNVSNFQKAVLASLYSEV